MDVRGLTDVSTDSVVGSRKCTERMTNRVEQVVDYVTVYFELLTHDGVPSTATGKFVQIESASDQILAFAPREMCTFHANIVHRFAELNGLAGEFNAKRDEFSLEPTDGRVIGGAHWKLSNRIIELFGHSMAYGGLDLVATKEALQRAQRLPPWMDGCAIEVTASPN